VAVASTILLIIAGNAYASPDNDADGIPDASDNCPDVYNQGQRDDDGDGLGNKCDSDRDGDGVANTSDRCSGKPGSTSNGGCPLPPPPVDTGGFVAGEGSASVNRLAFVKLSNTCRNVTLPPGTYLVDNNPSLGFIHVFNYCGTFTMQEGAVIRYTNPWGSGVRFRGGTGARLLNWESYHPVPTRTEPADNLSLYGTTDFLVDDATIHGGLAGILIWESTRPTIRDTYVENTKADGMHVVATTDARVYNYHSYWTGDDGLSFLLYDGNLNKYGAIADGVTVEQSAARGITVIGSKNTTIRNFTVRNTWTAGIQVACEPQYNDCSKPVENVTYEHGQVFDAGRSSVRGEGSIGPNPDSIFVHNANQNIVMNDIVSWSPVRNCYGTADGGDATLINVRGDGPGC
jgi:hypothetical protein